MTQPVTIGELISSVDQLNQERKALLTKVDQVRGCSLDYIAWGCSLDCVELQPGLHRVPAWNVWVAVWMA